MGSPVQNQGHNQGQPPKGAPPSLAPETLARIVLRCRELAQFLEESRSQLPARNETPFLYGQLDDVLERLHASLRPFAISEGDPSEKSGGFLRRLTSKKPRARRSEPRYDLEGNAWTIPVTELVGFLSHSGKSGLLWVASTSETFVLEFERGHLVHATSNAPPVAFRLGEILLKEKMLEPEELARLIDSAKAADDLLGSYLLRCGRLHPSHLQRALAIQVQQLFHRLMDAENSVYRFQEGAQLLRSYSLEVNITHLLLESARKKDEERERAEPAAGARPPAPKAAKEGKEAAKEASDEATRTAELAVGLAEDALTVLADPVASATPAKTAPPKPQTPATSSKAPPPAESRKDESRKDEPQAAPAAAAQAKAEPEPEPALPAPAASRASDAKSGEASTEAKAADSPAAAESVRRPLSPS
jgi:uncharacterized protein DUF4388